jgi:hypothetical protein
VGGLGRHLVSFFVGVMVSEFGVKELVLDTFPLSSTFRLTLVGTGGGVSIADGGLQRISSISFLRDLIVS